MRKIVITGPESSGKSSLAQALAKHYGVSPVPEYARTYLERLDRAYEEKDLLSIAKGQVAWEETFALQMKDWLILDTSLIVLKIWSEHKYGRCHPYILEKLQSNNYDLFLLCRPDIPWVFDPLRENPFDRETLFVLYQRELQVLGFPYVEVSGEGKERLNQAIDALHQLAPC